MLAAQKTETEVLRSKSSWATDLMRVSIAVTNTKSNMGRKKNVFTSQSTVYHHGKSEQQFKWGRTLGAGADAEAIEGCCLLTCSPWLTSSAFFQHPGPPARGAPPPIVGWAFYTNCYRFACRQTSWRHFSIESSSSQMTLACVKP